MPVIPDNKVMDKNKNNCEKGTLKEEEGKDTWGR
jgi:hypothetical protein